MTAYILGVAVGLAYGAAAGVIKYLILWRGIAKSDRELTSGALYARFGASFVINFVVLLAVFLLRKIMPFDFYMTILATAIGLSISGKLVPMPGLASRVKEK